MIVTSWLPAPKLIFAGTAVWPPPLTRMVEPLIVVGFTASLKFARIRALVPTPVDPSGGATAVTVPGLVSLELPVKRKKFWLNWRDRPFASFSPVVTSVKYVALAASRALGVKRITELLSRRLTVLVAIGDPEIFWRSLILASTAVVGSIGLLNSTSMTWFNGTPLLEDAGFTLVTTGFTVLRSGATVNTPLKFEESGLPEVSCAPVLRKT